LRKYVMMSGPKKLAIQLRNELDGLVPEARELRADCRRWMKKQIPLPEPGSSEPMLEECVNWRLVANCLKSEWKRHGHRPLKRLAELLHGLPWEHVEADAEKHEERELRKLRYARDTILG
jgi:hypothetical protein